MHRQNIARFPVAEREPITLRRAAHASVTVYTEKPRMSRSRESSTQSDGPGSLGTRLENPQRCGQGGLQTNLNPTPTPRR